MQDNRHQSRMVGFFSPTGNLAIMLLILFTSSFISETTSAKTFKWSGTSEKPTGLCTAELYVPAHGKFKNVIKDDVIAELQNKVLGSLAARAGMQLTVNISKDEVSLSEITGIEEASELACSLILYERVFNLTSNLKTFSVKSIIKPMEEITTILSSEVNKRRMVLKGYCNEDILEEVKILWEDVYQTYVKAFVLCLNYLMDDGPAGVYSCVEGVDWVSSGGKHDFMKFIEQFSTSVKTNQVWKPTLNELKNMEAHIIVFRNYANFRVMSLLTLVNAYIRSGGKQVKGKVKHFLTVLHKETDLFIGYANFIHGHIRRQHEQSFHALLQSQRCQTSEKDNNKMECSFQFSTMQPDQMCSICVAVSSYDQTLTVTDTAKGTQTFVTENADSEKAAKHFATTAIRSSYEEFISKVNNMVETHWRKSLLTAVDLWQEIRTSSLMLLRNKYDQEETIVNKLKPHQMKQVNVVKSQIKKLQEASRHAKKHHGFKGESFRHDEL